MPRLLIVCLLFWLTIGAGLAQDTALVLNAGMFSPDQRIDVSTLPGWLYHAGHNPAWARPILSTTGWLNRPPGDLSAKDIDAAGKAEGWFRLRIRLDATFTGLPLGIYNDSWAATEVYVNGRLAATFGNTGTRHPPYAEYKPYFKLPIAFRLVPGQDYLLAIHQVDYLSPFPHYPGKKLRSEVPYGATRKHSGQIQLTGPRYSTALLTDANRYSAYVTLWSAVAVLLALFFWLLSSQNLYEKTTIRLLALFETFFAITNLCQYSLFADTSFLVSYESLCILHLCGWQVAWLAIVTFLTIMGYPVAGKWIGIGALAFVAGAILDLYVGDAIVFSVIGGPIQQLVNLYLVVTCWKRLKGAQWAMVVGFFINVLFTMTFAIYRTSLTANDFYLLYTGAVLSIPLSFVVYIALRFNEILAEVRQQAAAVVQVTEEKQQLLATQNQLLEQQVEARTAELNTSLQTLQATQVQLIHKEKLASLGELTAGIAHEIQNPLNFVNNFSEVSAQLVGELKEEALAGRTDDVLSIADGLDQNLRRITLHGGRASSIVKGMLEHSRTSTGEKRSIDLNALADEYLKLAYQSLQSKDKNFNCELITSFDPALGTIEAAPQEIGRVLLNLYNNAFYAVSERGKSDPAGYKPMVSVSTKRVNGQSDRQAVEIQVHDNGQGISEGVQAKIFQPFFTTKPTGQGTGLGLSLSYDIVTKGHGGDLKVESQEGEGTTFAVTLPVRS